MYRLTTLFQSRFSNSDHTADTTFLKNAAHPPSIAISLSTSSKSQLVNGYPAYERHGSTSRLSKIWSRFGRRSRDDFSAYEGGNTNGEFYNTKEIEKCVSTLGVADKPTRKHPFRRQTISHLNGEQDEEDNFSGVNFTDQVGLLANASIEPGQRSPSMIRSKQFGHRSFLQRKSRPPLIKTSSDPNIDWYYKPSTPSPVEVEISVEVVSRPAYFPDISSSEESRVEKQRIPPSKSPSATLLDDVDKNLGQQSSNEINRFDLAFLEDTKAGLKETISKRRMNRSRASLPNISTDPAIIVPSPVQNPIAYSPTVHTSGENTPGLAKENSVIARKMRERRSNSALQIAVANNSMRRATMSRSQDWPSNGQIEEDVDVDGTTDIRSTAWSDVVPDSPAIPSAPPPSPWVINANEGVHNIETSSPACPTFQPNPWASMGIHPVSLPTYSTVPPQFYGQHIQHYTAAKTASPSPLGIITRKDVLVGNEPLDSPSWPSAPPCTPCTPFPES